MINPNIDDTVDVSLDLAAIIEKIYLDTTLKANTIPYEGQNYVIFQNAYTIIMLSPEGELLEREEWKPILKAYLEESPS